MSPVDESEVRLILLLNIFQSVAERAPVEAGQAMLSEGESIMGLSLKKGYLT
jgi:hypothetical protein